MSEQQFPRRLCAVICVEEKRERSPEPSREWWVPVRSGAGCCTAIVRYCCQLFVTLCNWNNLCWDFFQTVYLEKKIYPVFWIGMVWTLTVRCRNFQMKRHWAQNSWTYTIINSSYSQLAVIWISFLKAVPIQVLRLAGCTLGCLII